MRPVTKYAKSGDVHIAYQIIGDGPLDLVFVMGWISHLDYFWEGPSAPFLARLASFSRLILFDKRGTGLSDRVAQLPTIEERMDDVRAVMDAAGCERAALLGISEGAAMCAVFAATYPQRTSALVMYGAYAKRLWHPEYPWAPTVEQRKQFLTDIETGWGGVVDLDTLAPSTIGDEPFRQWWATYLVRSASPGAALALAKMNTMIDIRHVLPAIHVPTLILHRTGDLDIDVGGARYMAERIPNAVYVELPGVDHLVFAEDQDAVLDEIEAFLTGMPPRLEPRRILVTLLYVEIAGAMGIAARLGDHAWRDIVDAYGRVVREAVARYRGTEVKATVAGFLATFDGPGRAIHCARAISGQMHARHVDVRAGLHTGECEVIDGEPHGVAVQIVTRVAARAAPGDVLVTSTVSDLVAGSGIEFEPVDIRLMAGSNRALQLFRVAPRTQPTGVVPRDVVDEDGTAVSESTPLSPREREVAVLVGHGLSNRHIADELSISVATVERHVSNIFNKLGLHSRARVSVWVAQRGLLNPDPD
jgi:pimeloyl-ACP methyl ester carboxylesterase/DNA-binding CsgD family transcriptional regulator